MDAAGSSSDLENPLLPNEQGQRRRRPESQRSLTSPSDGSKRQWKDRPIQPLHSGKWQFKFHKTLEDTDFADGGGLSQGQREYNKRQRETIAGFGEVDTINDGKDPGPPEPEDPGVNRAINLSNVLNGFLLVVKIYASVHSGSLAILASTLDSLLDMVAGFVLWFSHYYMQKKNRYKYPIGKLRIWLIVIMGLAIVIKLGLYSYCSSFDNDIVSMYAMDHFFDVVTNLVGLAAALLGDYFFWWIDPAGAIFLALYTIVNWARTLLENALSLVGKAASPQVIQKFTYMDLSHDPRIKRIDTVRAYTFGTFYFVEVDIELPEDMLLKEAHSIGEALQNKLERLPEVERAFVHLDYECEHTPEHSAAESKH